MLIYFYEIPDLMREEHITHAQYAQSYLIQKKFILLSMQHCDENVIKISRTHPQIYDAYETSVYTAALEQA